MSVTFRIVGKAIKRENDVLYTATKENGLSKMKPCHISTRFKVLK